MTDKKRQKEIDKMCQNIRQEIFRGLTITNDPAIVQNYVGLLSHLKELQSYNIHGEQMGWVLKK
jgi:hypothetical protein